MIGTLLRLLWRAFVGLVAVGLAYGTFFLFYPYLDNRLPLLINLIIIYVFIAYFAIPFLLRLWHIVFTPHHVPLYAVSADGWSSDPVNIAIVCRSRAELKQAMKRAGWHVADHANLRNSIHLGLAVLFNRSYPTAPFSSLYLFGRRQDIGFQIQTGTPPSPRHRHHVRFWQLLPDESEQSHHHTKFWQSILHIFSTRKRQIWIGAATHDVGPFALRANSLQITHQIDHRTDIERDFVIETLRTAKSISRRESITAGEPLTFRGQTFGVNITTNGQLEVVELKKPLIKLP
jgi:hypothetical protein